MRIIIVSLEVVEGFFLICAHHWLVGDIYARAGKISS
jgi:hypothetical protein